MISTISSWIWIFWLGTQVPHLSFLAVLCLVQPPLHWLLPLVSLPSYPHKRLRTSEFLVIQNSHVFEHVSSYAYSIFVLITRLLSLRVCTIAKLSLFLFSISMSPLYTERISCSKEHIFNHRTCLSSFGQATVTRLIYLYSSWDFFSVFRIDLYGIDVELPPNFAAIVY